MSQMSISVAVRSCYGSPSQYERIAAMAWVFASNAEAGSFIDQCTREGYDHAHIRSTIEAIKENRLPMPLTVEQIMTKLPIVHKEVSCPANCA